MFESLSCALPVRRICSSSGISVCSFERFKPRPMTFSAVFASAFADTLSAGVNWDAGNRELSSCPGPGRHVSVSVMISVLQAISITMTRNAEDIQGISLRDAAFRARGLCTTVKLDAARVKCRCRSLSGVQLRLARSQMIPGRVSWTTSFLTSTTCVVVSLDENTLHFLFFIKQRVLSIPFTAELAITP